MTVTATRGFGTSIVGLTPFGLGTPATAGDPPAPAVGAPYVDARTRDYVVAADGELERMPPTRQRVLLALTHLARSSSVEPDGTDLPRQINRFYARRAELEIRRRLAPMVRDGSLRIDAIDVVSPSVGNASHVVRYTDLLAGEDDEVRV